MCLTNVETLITCNFNKAMFFSETQVGYTTAVFEKSNGQTNIGIALKQNLNTKNDTIILNCMFVLIAPCNIQL